MVLEAISYAAPTCPTSIQTSVDLSNFTKVLDGHNDTCEMISGPGLSNIEFVWRFIAPKSGLNRFRVILSGSQNCSDRNVNWFTHNGMTGNSTDCRAAQNDAGEFKECEIICHCLCIDCKYLRFRSHMPPWFERTLAICYFEVLSEYPYPVEVPVINDWVFIEKSRQ